MKRPTRMRTKNPFCTGAQLAVLRVIIGRPDARVRDMALAIKMSSATFAHTLAKLQQVGHIKKSSFGHYALALTGRLLVECADRIEYARRQSP